MKKNLKLVLALILAAMMIVGSMSVAVAADKTRTITVSGLEEGDTVNFYKVLDWADDDAEAEAHNSTVSGWYWASPFDQVLTKDDLYNSINDKNQMVLTDTLAGKIARVIAAKSVSPLNNNPVAAASGSASYTVTEDEDSTNGDGLYMAIVTPGKKDYTYNPIFMHLDSSTETDNVPASSGNSYMNTDGHGAAKKSNIPLEKEAHNENGDYNNDDGDTTKPGDILDFKVTTAIPGYGDTFTAPAFKLTDTLNGLKLSVKAATDFVIKVGGEEIAATNYTVTGNTTGSQSYTIEFTSDYLKTIKTATELTVEYKAEVQEGANTNVIKEKNTVELEYSHDPSTESDEKPGGDKKYQKDVTNHYTFSIDANNLIGPYEDRIGESGSELVKVGVDKDGKPIIEESTWSNVTTTKYQAGSLAGAEFELLDASGNSFSPKKTATSDAKGRINFTGLDAGTYKLKETKAPAGYVKNSDIVDIVIDATIQQKEITEYYDQAGNWYTEAGTGRTAYTYYADELVKYSVTYGGKAAEYTFDHVNESKGEIKWNITSSEEAPQSITNTKGVELPSTGGMGTTIFYVGGSILVLAAAILLVTKRRMGVED